MTQVSWLPAAGAIALALAAIIGGSPVTLLVFRAVDSGRQGVSPGVQAAGGVLRGGRAIGLLERAAVVATMLYAVPPLIRIAACCGQVSWPVWPGCSPGPRA